MYKRIIWEGFLSLAIGSGNSIAGKIYKCTDAEGNVTFSDSVCPYNTKEKQAVKVPSRPSPSYQAPSFNPYSVENQLRQMKLEKELARAERRSRESQAELDRTLRKLEEQKKSIPKAPSSTYCKTADCFIKKSQNKALYGKTYKDREHGRYMKDAWKEHKRKHGNNPYK